MTESEQATEDPGSALHGSIKGKKDLSYYYAHAPRDTNETPAAMPVHTPIAKETYTPGERVTPIKTFQFLDDIEYAKVYLPMEGLDTITMENVTSNFEPTSFSLTIRGLKSTAMNFLVTKLHKEINPEECVVKIMKTKILVKLKKVLDGGEDEDEEDDTAAGTPTDLAEEAEMLASGTEEPSAEDQIAEEPSLAVDEAADVPASGSEEHIPDLDGLSVEGKAVPEPTEQEAVEEVKPKKNKDPRYPSWHSLRA